MPHVAARTAGRDVDAGRYQRHRPEQTLFYQLVDEYYPAFAALMAEQGRELPGYVQREFEEFLKCGRLEHGFLRVRCETCHAEHLVAFSCKRRGFCPSCGARRMAESAALLVDEVLPEQPMRQWVLSFPFQLRFLFASRPEIIHRRGPWKTRESVELATLEWVSWFNHQRLMGPLGHIPPAEAEANYYRQLDRQMAVAA